MMIKKILCISALLIQTHLYSQKVIDDFGTWWGAEIRKTFLTDFQASVRAEYRMNENSSFTKNFYVAGSIKYAPLKWLYLNAGYRFDNRYEKEERYFNQRHRINFDLGFVYEVKRFEFDFRSRFQFQWEDYYSKNTEYPEVFNRNKLGIKYKWPQLPFSTFTSGELMLPIEQGAELSRFRLIVGQEYKLKKQHRFQLRFIFQTDLNDTEIWREYIISARYIFSF